MHVLHHTTFDDGWELVEDGDPLISTNSFQAVEPAVEEDCPIDLDLELLNRCQPEVEMMREACASGNLTAIQSVFQSQWLDRPTDDRIDQNELGAGGLCEAIKRDDVMIAGYLLSHVSSMQQVHFEMAVEYRAYSILQLYVDQDWDINTYSSRMRPPALS